jgi:5-methylcytosine-specific restriction endonuclease McrA
MSKRAAEEYLVHLAAKPAVSPGARKRRVPSLAPARAAGSAEPCQPDLYNFRFAADKGFMDKLERTAEVGGMGDALRNMREVLERTLDEYLERNDPEKRQQRRDKRAAAKANVGESAEPVALEDRRTAERPRTIPTQRRDQLLIRAGHRCEYRSSDGLRCSERSRLTIDHIVPWGLGGSNEAGNLRILCFAHNRLHADRCFGAEFMDQKIESARSNRRPSGYQPAPAEDPTVGERATRAITGEYGYRARGSACADPSRTTGIDHALPDRPLDREPGRVGNLVRTRFDVSTRHRLRRGGTLEPGRVRPHSPR